MTKGILGRKVGMTQIYDEAGLCIPVTVVQAGLQTFERVVHGSLARLMQASIEVKTRFLPENRRSHAESQTHLTAGTARPATRSDSPRPA